MFIPDVLQTIESAEKHGLSFVLLMIVLCLVVFFLGRRFVQVYAEHTRKLGAIDCMFESICDPNNPKRTVKRADIVTRLTAIEQQLAAIQQQTLQTKTVVEVVAQDLVTVKSQYSKIEDLVRQVFDMFRAFTTELGRDLIHALRNGKS